MEVIKTVFLCALVFFISIADGSADVEFDRVNGSDLEMGIGARAVGLAGAFVSIADDASAVFWNPAGLTHVATNQMLLSADLPSDFSAAALIYKPKFTPLEQYSVTLGVGVINRLSFKGDSGAGTWEGHPGHLLDLAMIDVGDDFSGVIDSKTYDLRLSLAMIPGKFKDFSLGVNLVHIS